MRWAYAVTTWSGAKLVETIHSVPVGARLLVIDNSQLAWPLARAWNYAIDRLCVREGYDVAIVMNDDVVLRPDTGELLARALLERQYGGGWSGPELLLVSARHAAPTDAPTDAPDRGLLDAAVPAFQPGPDFACFATSGRLFAEVGRFDERFNPAHFEDNDMHRRIQLAGFEGAAYAPYWHFLRSTIRTDPERRAVVQNGAFEQVKQYYLAKWGGLPGAETYTLPFAGRQVAV